MMNGQNLLIYIILAYPLLNLIGIERYTSLFVVLIILSGVILLIMKGNHLLEH